MSKDYSRIENVYAFHTNSFGERDWCCDLVSLAATYVRQDTLCVTIGKDSVIGGNVWLTRSVPEKSRILQGKTQDFAFSDGAGI